MGEAGGYRLVDISCVAWSEVPSDLSEESSPVCQTCNFDGFGIALAVDSGCRQLIFVFAHF